MMRYGEKPEEGLASVGPSMTMPLACDHRAHGYLLLLARRLHTSASRTPTSGSAEGKVHPADRDGRRRSRVRDEESVADAQGQEQPCEFANVTRAPSICA